MKIKNTILYNNHSCFNFSSQHYNCFGSRNWGVPAETVSVEMAPYDVSATHELVDVVYFKSVDGKTVMSDTPFD